MTTVTAKKATLAYCIVNISENPNPHSTPDKGIPPKPAQCKVTGLSLPKKGSGSVEENAEIWEFTIMYLDTQKRWVDALLSGNYLQVLLAMVRKFFLVLLFAWLAAAAVSTGILGVAKWVDMMRVELEAPAAAANQFSNNMVALKIVGG